MLAEERAGGVLSVKEGRGLPMLADWRVGAGGITKKRGHARRFLLVLYIYSSVQ
jgi:hypothetical protein